MSIKNNKIPEKLEISKIIFAPVYHDVQGIPEFHFYDNRWKVLYQCCENKNDNYFGAYRDLLDNFKIVEVDSFIHNYYYADISKSKALTDYLPSESENITYEELLYMIKPILLYLEKKHNKEAVTIDYNSDDCIYKPICYKTKDGYDTLNRLVKPNRYFAIDVKSGSPISYDFVCDEIPFAYRNDMIREFELKEKSKSLIKRIFKNRKKEF